METGNQTDVLTANSTPAHSAGVLAKLDTKQFTLAVLCCVNSPGVILTKAYTPLFARTTKYQMTAALDYKRVLSDSDVLLLDRFGVGLDDDHVFYDFIAQNNIPYVICNSSDCALEDRLQRNKWLNEILGKLCDALQSIRPTFDIDAEYQRGLENLGHQFGKRLVEEVLANRGDLPLYMPEMEAEPDLVQSAPAMESHSDPEATVLKPSYDEVDEVDLSTFALDVDSPAEFKSETYEAEEAGSIESPVAASYEQRAAPMANDFEQPIVDAVFDDPEPAESLDTVAPAQTDHRARHRAPSPSSAPLSYGETSATPPPVSKPSSSDKLADIFSEIRSYTEDKRIAAILEKLPMQDYNESQNDKPIVTANEFTFDYSSMEAYAQERARIMQASQDSISADGAAGTTNRQSDRRQGRPEFQIHAKQAQEDLAQLFTKGELANGNLKSWLNNVVANKKRKKK